MPKNYKKLMEMEIKVPRLEERLDIDPNKHFKVRPDKNKPIGKLDEFGVVKDMMVMGKRAAAMKWGISLSKMNTIKSKVYNRINNQYLRKGDKMLKRVGLQRCTYIDKDKARCGYLVIRGRRCNAHTSNRNDIKGPDGKMYDLKSAFKSIERQNKVVDAVLGRAPVRVDAVEVSNAAYRKVMEAVIEYCKVSHKSYAKKYFAEFDNDLVQMAVDGKFTATRPVKCMLVKSSTQIRKILRGVENKFNERFNEEAAKWTVIYSDMAKDAERELLG